MGCFNITKKTFLAVFVFMAVLFGGYNTTSVNAATVSVDSTAELVDKVNNATEATTVELSDSFPTTLTEAIKLNTSHNFAIVVDGKGKELKTGTGFRHFELTKGTASLTLQNMDLVGNLVWDGENPQMIAANGGGGISIDGSDTGITTLSNMNISNIMSGNGAIQIGQVRVTLQDVVAKDCAGYQAGVIFTERVKALLINNSSFIHNGGNYNGGYPGGAIFVKYLSGSFTVNNSHFKDNFLRTAAGGVTGGGGAIAVSYPLNGNSIRVSKSYFEGNIADRDKSTSNLGDGGAIAIINQTHLVGFTVENSTFKDNVANDDGGAILIQSDGASALINPTSNINNSTFINNTAHSAETGSTGMSGGAIQAYTIGGRASTVNVKASTFVNNTALQGSASSALQGGGAIAGDTASPAYGPAISLKGSLFVNNKVLNNSGTEINPTYANIYNPFGSTTSAETIGGEASKLDEATLDTTFGGFTPKASDNFSTVKAGAAGNQVTVPTVPIVPKTDNTGNADSFVATASNSITTDERGLARPSTAKDAGAVEMAWIKYNKNEGVWNLPALTEYDGKTFYEGTTPDDKYQVGYLNQATTTISDSGLTREGFTFKGWNTQVDGKGTTYQVGDAITMVGTATLYAIWEANEKVDEYGWLNITLVDYKDKLKYLAGGEFEVRDANDNVVASGVTTSRSGKVSVYDLKVGEYTLVQTKAPSGYNMSASVKFTISKDEAYSIRVLNREIPTRMAKTAKATTVDQTGQLKIVALNVKEDNKTLSGATFRVTNFAGDVVKEVTTNSNGEVVINDLANGTYNIELIKAPNGYVTSDYVISTKISNAESIVRFNISKNNTDEEQTVKLQKAAKADGISARAISYLSFSKYYYDANNDFKGLPGAQFEIVNLDTSTSVGVYETDGNGEILLSNFLDAGNYKAVEVSVPSGYQVVAGQEETNFEIIERRTTYVEVENEKATDSTKGSTTLTKYDALTGENIEGVEFQLLDASKTPVKTGLLTDANGQITVNNLEPGKYYWQETKPTSDYMEDDTMVEVNVVVQGAAGTSQPNSLKDATINFEKIDKDTLAKLPGAQFTITGTNLAGQNAGTFNRTTDATGAFKIVDMQPGTYTITETVAPEGYKMLTSPLTLTVNKGGDDANAKYIIENTKLDGQKYTVTYDGTSYTAGTVPTDPLSPYVENATVTVAEKGDMDKVANDFIGWSTKEDGTGTTYQPGATFTITEDTTLYAQWKIKDQYTVIYNGNTNTGGAVPTDSASPYYKDSTVTVLGKNTLTKTNYKFIGWNTQADGKGTTYQLGETFKITANTTLYAQWEELAKYKITYNGNGNTGGAVPTDSASPYYEGITATILDKGTMEFTDKTFTGWNTQADGKGDSYAANGSVVMTKDLTLYAQWIDKDKFSITYVGNGNTGGATPSDTTAYTDGSSATILDKGTLERDHYDFTGWNTAANGSGTDYAANGTITMTENVTLYAQWEEHDKFTVTYYGNGNSGGSAPSDSQSPYYDGSTVTVLDPVGNFWRDDYTFVGWNTQADGKGTEYRLIGATENPTFKITEDTKLYAQWEPKTAGKVLYDGNGFTGGTVPVDAHMYLTGDVVTVKDKGTMERKNYTFVSWNTKANGSGTEYIPGDTSITWNVNTMENMIFYAQWEENEKYAVTYNGNTNTGGVVPTDSQRYHLDTEATILGKNTLVKTNYTFTGWNTEADGNGTDYAVNSKITIKGNITLYAQWKENSKHTVTYDGNTHTSGTAPTDANIYYIGTSVTILGKGDIEKEGYTFLGWCEDPNATTASHIAGKTFTITKDTTLYAVWKKDVKKVTVIFDKNATSAKDGSITSQTLNEGNSIKDEGKAMGNPTRKGYKLVGWCTTKEACYDTKAKAGSKFTASTKVSADITVYAQWQKVEELKPTPEPIPGPPKGGVDATLIGVLTILGAGLVGLRLRYRSN